MTSQNARNKTSPTMPMITEAAHDAVERFINDLNCQSRADVLLALNALLAMATAAHNMVATSKGEVVQ
jgi:hypothetical protein